MLQCLFCCCDEDEQDEGHDASQHSSSMSRGAPNPNNPGIYRVAPQASHDEEDDDGECLGYSEGGLQSFIRSMGRRFRRHDSVVDAAEEEHIDPLAAGAASPAHSISSPLRTAASFDSSTDIPTINVDEIVLPGSALQKEMARAASLNLEKQDDECVICMECFDPTNPRMPTLCGCGQNKTYFHLPCLYQWIEQSRECPSCRQKLRWEEF